MRNNKAAVSDPNQFYTSPGSEDHVIYSPRVNPDGTVSLFESGRESIKERINSFREQTDIAYILKRLQLGDTSVLRSDGAYGDFTQMPKTFAEALQLQIDGEKKFMQLPLDVRNEFDNDFRKWFASAGSEDWLNKMLPVLPDDMRSMINKPGDASVDPVDPALETK